MKEKLISCKAYPWIVVGLLWIVALLNYMDRQMLSTMRDAMQIDISELESAVNFGRLMAIFLWIYGLVSPFAGAIADRVSRKWLIIASLGVWSAVTTLMSFCTNYNEIFWLRALMGVSEALYIPAALSLIADYHTGKSRSFAIGIHMTGLYLGQAVGGFGATLAAAFSWQQTFHWFGIIGIAYAVLLMVLLYEKRDVAQENISATPEQKIPVLKGFGMIFSNMAFWVILFFFASTSLPGWATKNWLPTLFADSLNTPMSQAGPISTITIALSSFLGILAGGPLSDKWVKRNVKGRVYTSAIGYGMFDTNNMPILCQFVPSKLRATAYGIMNMTGVMMGAVCTQILGKWAEGGNLGLAFAVLGCIIAVALVAQITILNPTTDDMQ